MAWLQATPPRLKISSGRSGSAVMTVASKDMVISFNYQTANWVKR